MGLPDSVVGRDPSPFSLTLVAVVLAIVAGFVDSVGFLHVVDVFPANQSGNVAFLGLSIAVDACRPAAGRGDAPRTGASAADGIGRRAGDGQGERAIQDDRRAGRRVGSRRARDGLANRCHPRRRGVAVSTTYQSGAIARIGENIGTPSGSRERESGRRLVVVLSVVLLAYVGGAALGASRLGDGRTGLLVPVALVAGLFGVACARPWS